MILQNLKTLKVIEVSDKQAQMLLTTKIFAVVQIIPDEEPEPIEEKAVIKKTRKAKK